MAFRLYNPAPVYMDLAGTAPAAAGTLETYSDEACTTPLVTYNSPDLDVANPTEIDLDADGRASVEIWSSVAFFLRLKESDGTVVWTREITSGVPAGLTLPALEPGEYLTGDGVGGYAGDTPYALPDPTGSAGYAVVANADGDGYTLQAFPEAPEAPTLDITVGQAEFIVGDGESTTKQVVLTGSATGTNAGGRTQTVSVTFSTAFAATPNVQVTLANTSSLASGQNQPSPRVSSKSTTGFTVEWMMGETDDDRTQFDFNAAVTFDWMAFGTRVIAA
jgi:hypothetical protein